MPRAAPLFEFWNARSADIRTLHVRWLQRPGHPPLHNVHLRVQDGVLVEIQPDVAPAGPDFWDGILVPPFVNAHTHLEFSSLSTPLQPARPFPAWISAVIAHRQARSLHSGMESTPSSAEAHVRQGLQEIVQHGIRGAGEISTSPVSEELARALTEHRVVSFRECIGLDPDGIARQIQTCEQHLRTQPVGGRHGISPHAPYSVHPELFSALIELAASTNAPVAMHLGETSEEIEFLHDGTGLFAEFLKTRGLWRPDACTAGRSLMDFLQPLSALSSALVIHANYLTPSELQFLTTQPSLTVVYCPRTHSFFDHPPHPWQALRAAGVRVVLGTDSRASNPDLCIWRELQFLLTRHSQTTLGELLPMITSHAARALQLPAEHYQLRRGLPLDGVLLNHAGVDKRTAAGLDLEALARHPDVQPRFAFTSGQLTALTPRSPDMASVASPEGC